MKFASRDSMYIYTVQVYILSQNSIHISYSHLLFRKEFLKNFNVACFSMNIVIHILIQILMKK